jgi:hypothetical protein
MNRIINNGIKKEIFEFMINSGYRFYMNIIPTEQLIVGKRGLTPEEKETGLTLIFSKTSYKNLSFDEHFIYCDMKFKGIWENLKIPIYAINYILDDLYDPSFVFKFKISYPTKTIPENKASSTSKKPQLKLIK